MTAFYWDNRPAVSHLYLAHGARIDTTNRYSQTILHRAAIYGSVEQFEFLRGLGIELDADCIDQGGYSPLEVFIVFGCVSSVTRER